ncbi:MAG: archaemetzincin [Candidatus Eremiobacteraeota bacterium]|nr:archaemetzincin [Candidatus Eremiobacteraeota bacterium]
MGTVYLITVGTIHAGLMAGIIPALEERFLFRFSLIGPLDVPLAAYHETKGKYLVSRLCDTLRECLPHDGIFGLGITAIDLYDDTAAFMYYSRQADKVGILSISEFLPSPATGPDDTNLLFSRTLKEASHALGHLLGFKHCFHRDCVMYFSYSVNDTDRKSSLFCRDCEATMSRILRNLQKAD